MSSLLYLLLSRGSCTRRRQGTADHPHNLLVMIRQCLSRSASQTQCSLVVIISGSSPEVPGQSHLVVKTCRVILVSRAVV